MWLHRNSASFFHNGKHSFQLENLKIIVSKICLRTIFIISTEVISDAARSAEKTHFNHFAAM